MTLYPNTRAVDRPLDTEVCDGVVLVAEDIHQVTVENEDGTNTEWEYDLKVYTSREYIALLSEQNKALQSTIIETELALCDVYETIGG